MPHKLVNLVRAPGRLVRFLTEAPDLLQSVRKAIKAATEASHESAKLGRKSMKLAAASEKRVAALQKELQAVQDESRTLREELHTRLLQYNFQLGRLSRTRSGESEAPRLAARSVPLAVDEPQRREWEPVEGPPPDPAGREWLTLDACPACGHAQRTIVNPFNKLVLLKSAPDATAARYDYALCHACGIVYATRRPFGSRYRHLLEHFGEVTGKGGGTIKNPLLNPSPLTAADRQQLARMAKRGVWVSDHLRVPKGEHLEGLIKDRFENSVHLDLLASLVAPKGGRVLEIRPRTGTISEGLRRLFGAEVFTLPIWESQRFLLKEVYGIDSPGLVDYDEFTIPFEGRFDLIVCNHMFTHAVRPARFFDTIASHLNPGGYVYLYNEPEDTEFVKGAQSMLASLNPLHMQTFDQPSLVRGLAARGFNVVFLKSRNLNHMCLAQPGATQWSPMTTKELEARLRAYRLAYDRAVLLLPPDVRPRFADEWPQIVERGVAEGLAEFDADGNLRLVGRAALR
ncbi:MAG TPA: class I SAM-dependent methyltransferase [Vicinamibacterales bacterium]|nr:class I SAM-dependent methyltransferase [Vicinamibacterales bacterium]